MANIGLRGVWIAPYVKEITALTFPLLGGKKYGKAVAMAVNNTTSEANLNADDGLDDSVKVITQANISYTPNGFSLAEESDLLGYSEGTLKLGDDSTGKTAYGQGVDTEGGLVSCAFIVPTRRSGVEAPVVLFYPKVKFSPADSEDYATKGDNVSFGTPAYTGKAFTDTTDKFRHKIGGFDNVAAAVEYLNNAFHIEAAEDDEEEADPSGL